MKMIGLTGPTGAGKSSLTDVAKNFGYKVIDCDKTARQAVEKGTDGLIALTKVFGEDILLPDGNLNRKELAKKAFATKENTQLLNKTLLPFIADLIRTECDREYVLLDAPTLFESGMDSECDATIAVLADESLRLERIKNRDGLTDKQAKLRMGAGQSDDFYKKNADFVICNNGDMTVFTKEFEDILKEIKER